MSFCYFSKTKTKPLPVFLVEGVERDICTKDVYTSEMTFLALHP